MNHKSAFIILVGFLSTMSFMNPANAYIDIDRTVTTLDTSLTGGGIEITTKKITFAALPPNYVPRLKLDVS